MVQKVKDWLGALGQNQKLAQGVRWGFQILVVVVFGIMTAMCLFSTVAMQEGSMEPTFSTSNKFWINKVIYKFSEPKRGDIIVFKTSPDDDASLHIKRVIGLPGETIQIRDGQILIDGVTYREGRDLPKISNPGLATNEVYLESDEYFVLGDNRNNSEDSRYVDVGNVKKKYIAGKIWFRVTPFKKAGFLKE